MEVRTLYCIPEETDLELQSCPLPRKEEDALMVDVDLVCAPTKKSKGNVSEYQRKYNFPNGIAESTIDGETPSDSDSTNDIENDEADYEIDDNEPKQAGTPDSHTIHSTLYVLSILCFCWWLIAVIHRTESLSPSILLCLSYILFLYEFFFSSTHKYLKNMNTTEGAVEYLERLYRTPPVISLCIECYHRELQTEQDNTDNGKQRTPTGAIDTVTFRATEPVDIVAWKNIFSGSDTAFPYSSQHHIIKMKLRKSVYADRNFDTQCAAFIARNKYHDRLYNFHIELDIDGFSTEAVLLSKRNTKPFFLSYTWCLLMHLTVVFALPYRIWMSSICLKVEAEICKQIKTHL